MKKQKTCYLTRERTIKTTPTKEFHIDHWRLCNAKGNDLVMPWFNSSSAARQEARDRNWKLVDAPYNKEG